LPFLGQKVKFWISLLEKLQFELKRVSIASLNVLQGLFGITGAFL
jgi:hypothetical protein